MLPKKQLEAPSNPYFKYGLIRVKYGVDTGSIRVRQTQGFTYKPRVSQKKYGLIRVKYGLNTGSVRVWFTPKFRPYFFLHIWSYLIRKMLVLCWFSRNHGPNNPRASGNSSNHCFWGNMVSTLMGFSRICISSNMNKILATWLGPNNRPRTTPFGWW